MDAEAGLRLETLRITIGGRELVAVDAHVAPGEAVAVMGPSGTGKSTLLAAVIGAIDPAFALTGRVLLDGRDVTPLPPEDRHVGILFQEAMMFPHLSVGSNLAFGLRRSVKGRASRAARVEEALAEVGLEGFARRDPATLSGGQRARAALVRMLLSEPKALLLDEPFSGLDRARRIRTRELVFDVARRRMLPVLLVTHDEEDAAEASRVIRIGPDQASRD